MERLLVALVISFWASLLGWVANWMAQHNGSISGVIACSAYAALYFWFAATVAVKGEQ